MRKRHAWAVALGLVLIMGSSAAFAGIDFGLFRDGQLRSRSNNLFGVSGPLPSSSTDDLTLAEGEAAPKKLFRFARSLDVDIVASGLTDPDLGGEIDMLVPWPNTRRPKYLLACNESDETVPGFQRIEIATGHVTTILTGTVSCDGSRQTAWGTLLFSEEEDDGRVYELMDPLHVQNVTLDRSTGTFSGGTGTCPGGTGGCHFAVRDALGLLAYEGFALYPSGLVYYGDELRPEEGAPGGSIFKFVPEAPFESGQPPISDLDDSPFAAGTVYGLRLGARDGNTDYGFGTSYGLGVWVSLTADPGADLRALAADANLTAYYRPEDIEVDLAELAQDRVRFCVANTGNEGDDRLWGELICATDGSSSEALAGEATPEVQLFVAGSPALSGPDNLAYQPGRGNWIVHEDAAPDVTGFNNDLWSCLEDGADADLMSDGCIRIATLRDLDSEWTGGVFNHRGDHFWVAIQHPGDPDVAGHAVILEVTHWR